METNHNVEAVQIHLGIQKLMASGKYENAEKYLKEMMEEKPYLSQNEYLTLDLVKALRKNEKYEESLSLAFEMSHSNNRRYFLSEICLCYLSMDDYENAYKYLKQLVEEEPTYQYKYYREYNLMKMVIAKQLYQLDSDKYAYLQEWCVKATDFKTTINHVMTEHSFKEHTEHKSYFYEDVNIIAILKQIQKRLETDKNLIYIKSFIGKQYYFKENEDFIGISPNNNKCNVISVITNLDDQIITAFPINDIDSKYINPLYEIEKASLSHPVKIKSRIEKFNEKYHM